MSWKDNPIMYWDGEKISDHNRQTFSVTSERIENRVRMIDGTMRSNFVTEKFSFSTSWENLPSTMFAGSEPVDMGLTGPAMEQFWRDTTGPFTLTLRDGQGEQRVFQVYFDDFSFEVVKRGKNVDLWNVDVQLVEV